MADVQASRVRIERARELFFTEQRDPTDWVAPHISRSWRRSLPATRGAIDPAPLPLALLHERREQAMQLLQCAQPELDGLAEHATGNGCVVILTDASGLILDEIGSPDFIPQAERFALTPGVEWSEDCRGTNAIGTALAEREALMVLGGEHYLPRNGGLGCAAAPIFTSSGTIAGAIDISGEAVRVGAHALGLVRLAAQQIEHRMMLAGPHAHLLRFHRRPSLIGTPREGLLFIDGGRIAGANRAALEMLGATWDSVLGSPAEPVIGQTWARLERQRGLITLPGGQQIAAVTERSTRRAVTPAATLALPAAAAPADAVAPLLTRAVRVLDAGVALLITGETGTGKDVFARRLHGASRRRAGPFVAVNCAALPEALIEAELFGYDEGAFTGARRRGMPGRLREADGGMLSLDEIADMPLALQPRLLRALEEREVTPLGGGAAVKVDFDLVCATHEDLTRLASLGRFRPDLLFRVAGYGVALPALRERADRHQLIARLFNECGGDARHLRLDDDALQCLAAYRWPGNVRELRNTLQALAALADAGDAVTLERLPAHLRGAGPLPGAQPTALEALAQTEERAIDLALERSGHNVAEAARRLGVHRSTVYRHRARRGAAE